MAHDHAHDHDSSHDHSAHALGSRIPDGSASGSHAGHAHGPGGHVHAPASFGRAFAIGIGLNTAFIVVEAVYGFLANSSALIADAGHNLSDVLGLIIAWGASVLARRAVSERMTYGWRSISILAALVNALLLLVACGAIILDAVNRIVNPEPIASITVMVVAAIGIVINGLTAWLFASGRHTDLNIRGAYLHMAADAAISAGVVVAGFVIYLTGWLWLDPVTSIGIVVVIVLGTWGLLSESTAMTMAAVPRHIDPAAVRTFLAGRPGVVSLHDLHIWSMSTTETALTAHLVMPAGHPGDPFIVAMAEELEHRFGIGHATLQIEIDPNTACQLMHAHGQLV